MRELAPDAMVIEAGRQPRLRRRPATAAPRRPRASCCCSSTPTPSSARASARRSSAPLADGRGWAAWQGLVTAEGGKVVNTARRGRPLHRDRLGRAGRGARRRRAAADGRAGVRLGRLPRDPPRHVFERGRRLRRRSSSSTTRTSTSRCGCGSPAGGSGVGAGARVDHDYEFDEGAREVAPAGAQPLGDADPHLSRGPAGRCSPRRCWPPSWRWSRSRSPAAGSARSSAPGVDLAALAAPAAARAARDPGAPDDRARASSPRR